MATIINNPGHDTAEERTSSGLVTAIVLIVILAVLFLLYQYGAFGARNYSPSVPAQGGGAQIDVNLGGGANTGGNTGGTGGGTGGATQ